MTALAKQQQEDTKKTAVAWFESLRDQICAEFEKIETELQNSDQPAGKFERKPWTRAAGGGGEMSIRTAC